MGQLENLRELSIAQSTHGIKNKKNKNKKTKKKEKKKKRERERKKKKKKRERNRKSSLISALVISSNGDSNEFWGIESCI
jgi:hypothetical protein